MLRHIVSARQEIILMGDERFDMVDTFVDAAHVKVTACGECTVYRMRASPICGPVYSHAALRQTRHFHTYDHTSQNSCAFLLLRRRSQTRMFASRTSRAPKCPRRKGCLRSRSGLSVFNPTLCNFSLPIRLGYVHRPKR